MTEHEPGLDPHLLTVLEPDEAIEASARATDATLAVSDKRLIVAARERVTLSIAIEGLRRIQFDIEKGRPATLVIVPEAAHDEPQVLAIPPAQIRATTQALALVAERLSRYSAQTSVATDR